MSLKVREKKLVVIDNAAVKASSHLPLIALTRGPHWIWQYVPNQLYPSDSDKLSTQDLQSTEDPGPNLCWIKSGASECWILVKELQTGDMCTWEDL